MSKLIKAKLNDRKADELILASKQHLANAETWATMAVYGPPEYKEARMKMVEHELKMAKVIS